MKLASTSAASAEPSEPSAENTTIEAGNEMNVDADSKKKRKKNTNVSSKSSDDEEDSLDFSKYLKSGKQNDNEDEDENDLDDDDDDKDEDEKNLEELVFGSEATIFSNIDKMNKNRKTKAGAKAVCIADEMNERKPAWQDADDQQL